MKTKTISIYAIGELSKKAQEKAHAEYLYHGGAGYAWVDESIESVKAFCNLFGARLTDWELSTFRHSTLSTDATQENFRGIKPDDIQNKWPTGYYLDDTLVSAFHDDARHHGDIKGAFFAALDAALSVIVADMEYQDSLEYFLEMAELNEWEYLEDGSPAWRCAA
jgi:hypothetical protein